MVVSVLAIGCYGLLLSENQVKIMAVLPTANSVVTDDCNGHPIS